MGSVTSSQGNELRCACGNKIKNVLPHLRDCATWICRTCVKKGLPKQQQEQLGGVVHYCKECGIELDGNNCYGLDSRVYYCKKCQNAKRRKKVA